MLKFINNYFYKRKKNLNIPNIINFQKNIYKKLFNKKSELYIGKTIKKNFPIISKDKTIIIKYKRIFIEKPKINTYICKIKKINYSIRIHITLQFNFYIDKNRKYFYKKINRNYIFCNLPLITKSGSFIINGIERTTISQIHKINGIFLNKNNKTKEKIIKIIPYKGFWLEIIMDKQKRFFFRINKKKKLNIYILFKFLGIEIKEILNTFCSKKNIYIFNKKIYCKYKKKLINNKIANYNIYNEKNKLIIKKGKIIKNLIKKKPKYISINEKKSNLIIAKNWKYKNIKLNINSRLNYKKIFKNIKNKKVKIKVFNLIEKKKLKILSKSIFLKKTNEEIENKILKTIKFKNIKNRKFEKQKIKKKFFKNKFLNKKIYFLSKFVRNSINSKLKIKSNSMLITAKDIIKSIKYIINSKEKKYRIDDIYSLENKRIRNSSQYIIKIIEKKFKFLKNNILERITKIKRFIDLDNIINSKIISSFINEFFCTSQFSQFLDQNNNLSEITHKRRLTILENERINKGMIRNKSREINITNYGKICPIETPEGQNIGIVNSFSILAKINKEFFIKSPYIAITNNRIIKKKVIYLSALEEYKYCICSSYNINNKYISKKEIFCRNKNKIKLEKSRNIKFIELASFQTFSIASLLIPFIEHNDLNRSLMGANMLKQAIPGIKTNKPYINTGFEKIPSKNLNYIIYTNFKCKLIYKDSKKIIIERKINKIRCFKIIDFIKFSFSNQKNLINNKINKIKKKKIKKGTLINDNTNTKEGILSLGQNLKVAFLPFYGYNFEDSIVISKKIANSKLFTSININEITVDIKRTNAGNEISNKNLFYIDKQEYNKLDKQGIACIGSNMTSNDILICKLTPKRKIIYSPEEKIVKTIFNSKLLNYKKSFIRIPKNIDGKLTKITIIKRGSTITKINNKEKNNFVNINIIKEEIIKKTIKEIEKKYCKFESKKFKNKILYKKNNNKNKSIPKKIKKLIIYNIIILNNRISQINKKVKIINNKKTNIRLNRNIEKRIIFTITAKRKLKIGDKMSGRHGNKGVISKIIQTQNMPYLKDGTICDIILNPLGIPSRMNLGQIYELNFGFTIFILFKRIKEYINKKKFKKIKKLLKKLNIEKNLKYKNKKIKYYKKHINIQTLPFEGANEKDLKKIKNIIINKKIIKKLEINKTKEKIKIFNGFDSTPFKKKIAFGIMYFIKLHHISRDKIHARSIGPYSLITQQPLKGRSKCGGQRFGEMEVWALESYGAAYTLQEMLTIKSDDIKGRKINYENIILGINKRSFNIPESFNILLKEMKALCINIQIKK
ncbi:MAG: DNA-directed RNA polymerase subunit beta [Candidatus Vidania fulgoroideorum]